MLAGYPSARERARHGLLVVLLCHLALISVQAAAFQTAESHLPPPSARTSPLGRLRGAQQLNLAISLPLRNQAQLTEFLHEITDPHSPNFRHYLTPAQFTAKYGPTQQDYDTVIAFAKANGLAVTGTHPNRMILDVAGPVSAIEQALHVKMWNYRHPQEARQFYAPDVAPTLNISVPVLGISGLSNYALPKPRYKLVNASAKPAPTASGAKPAPAASLPFPGPVAPNTGTGPNGGYMGSDFRNAYVPGVSLNGSGQTVGLLQFDGYTTSDITYYESKAGLTNVPLTNVLLDGFNGTPTGDGGEVEVSLDIEMAMSMAPGLAGIIVYEAGPNGNWHDILNRMADDNIAKQLSCSWYIPGGTMDTTADQIFQQMQAQGQSFYSASGDNDAFTGLIPFPGDTPYITEVGGTYLNTTTAGGAYSSESAWNREDGIGTGGGISTQYSIPTWQQGISMTANLGSTTMRNVPDVALTADYVYVRVDGSDEEVGGTSCAAPLWGGFTALVNQLAMTNAGTTVGFINPAVYAIGKGANYTTDFHDTASGNNYSTSSPNKFPAVTGYDLCTGWGTPTAALIAALAPTGQPVIATTGTLPPASSGVAYSETLAATSGTPAYTWSLLSGSLPAGLNLSSGGMISGSTTAVGTASFTLQVSDSRGRTGSMAFTLTVEGLGTPVITTNSPLPLASTAAVYNQQLAATAGVSPYTWAVTAGALPPGVNLDTTTGVLSGTPTATGTYTFTMQVTDSNSVSSTMPFTVTVDAPPAFAVTGTLTAGLVNSAYSQELFVSGGTSPYNYTVTSGSLPAGLTLTSWGFLGGTPTVSGTFNFSVTVAGADGPSSTQAFSLTIAPYGPLDHFAWSTITSPQQMNTPFPATITAQDAEDNTVASFNSSVSLSTGAAGTMLNSASPTYGGTGNWTLGYAFTPSYNITVNAVRSYSGTTVSLWTNSGTLLASKAVSGTAGTWTQTALSTPVQLTAGTTYRVAFYTGGTNGTYYIGDGLPSTFSAGTILSSYYSTGNAFPTTSYPLQWFLVDLAYTVGPSVANTPTTATLSSGVWSGSVSIAQPATGVVLSGNDGAGHSGLSNAFNVSTPADIGVTPSTGLTSSGTAGGPFTPASANYTVTNTGNGTMNWTAAGTQSWLTISPGTGTLGAGAGITVTATINSAANSLPAGNYSDTITFTNTTNGLGSTTRPVSLAVQLPAPVINSLLNATGLVGQSFSYQITATNSPTSYNATVLPPGLNVNMSSGLISGTPTKGGVYSVSLSASNGKTGTATLSLTIDQPPAITNGPAPATGVVGTAYSFGYSMTGTPAPTISVSAGGLPPGLTLTTGGLLSGTPTLAGLYAGTVDATNAISPDATQTFAITVANTFSSWESQFFSAQQLADPSITGQNADPGNDGVPNLLKYLFDINPSVPMSALDRAALPQVAVANVSGTNYLTLTYRQNGLAGGITVSVQTSPDLINWTTVTPALDTSTPINGTNDSTVQIGVPTAGAAMMYIRLHVTSP